MKVALVHDYLKEYGGAERVLEALHQIYPAAPLYTAYVNLKGLGVHQERFKNWDIRTSWLQWLPFASKLISPFRVLAPKIFAGFDLSEYDLVISSCNVYFSKNVTVGPKTLHISYIHTPPRYLYGYTTSFNYKKRFMTRVAGEIMNHFLRLTDFEVSQKPDILVANSKNVARRIKKFYRRDSVVIYPPVNLEKFKDIQTAAKGEYFLTVSRLVKGKGVESVIKAANLAKVKLFVVGTGPELEYLKTLAGSNITFLGALPDNELAQTYANAQATIVASEDEDFGIVPVESQTCGTPVIALSKGGFLETVVKSKTGEFFANLEELVELLQNFDGSKYSEEDLLKQAQKFSQERFKKEILKLTTHA